MKNYFIYILTSRHNSVLYVGMTSSLIKRVHQHKHKMIAGFTYKYNAHKLVYFESTTDVYSAIRREKRIKKWYRQWKIELIEKDNPYWRDIYYNLTTY